MCHHPLPLDLHLFEFFNVGSQHVLARRRVFCTFYGFNQELFDDLTAARESAAWEGNGNPLSTPLYDGPDHDDHDLWARRTLDQASHKPVLLSEDEDD